MTPEAREQSQIVKWAEQVGFVVLTTSEGRAVWRASGLPDLYLIQPALGLSLWWEVKAPKGRLSPTQEQFQALHEAAGRHAEARTVPGCHSGTSEDFILGLVCAGERSAGVVEAPAVSGVERLESGAAKADGGSEVEAAAYSIASQAEVKSTCRWFKSWK